MISLQFEASAFETRWRGENRSRFDRGRVRGMLPSRPPFWISIVGFPFHFAKSPRGQPRGDFISFCVAVGTSRGSVFRPPCSRAIERFRTREQQGGIASGHLSDCISGSNDRGFRWRGASSRRARLIGLLARRTSSAEHSGDPSIAVGQSFGFCL